MEALAGELPMADGAEVNAGVAGGAVRVAGVCAVACANPGDCDMVSLHLADGSRGSSIPTIAADQ